MKKEYVAPESKIVDVRAEGQLCASKDFETAVLEDWQEDVFEW